MAWQTCSPFSPAAAQPTAAQPYQLRAFAHGVPGSYSKPDSITVSRTGSIFIGYGNGVAKDGADGKSSTVVQYKTDGSVVRTFSVKGHNDGVKVNPRTGQVWALQNEDGNPNLVIIDPENATQAYQFDPPANGGGYDDVVFRGSRVFLSPSAPARNPNTDAAIVEAELKGSTVQVHPVMLGNGHCD